MFDDFNRGSGDCSSFLVNSLSRMIIIEAVA